MDNDQEARALLAPLRDHVAPPSTLDIDGAVTKGQRRIRTRRWTGTGGAALVLLSLVPVSLALMDRRDAAPPVALEPATSATPSPDTPVKPAPPAFPVSCTSRMLPKPPGATDVFIERGEPSGRYLVGGYADARGNRRPLLWDNGSLVTIDPPGQDTTSIVVNEQGVVAGTSSTTVEGKLDFYNWVYRRGAIELITEVGHGMVEYRGVIDINARSDVLLDSRIRMSPPAEHQGPAIWSGGRLRELAAPSGFRDVSANSFDDDGTVVGRHLLEDGHAGERTLVWTPDGKVKEFKAPNGFGPAGVLRQVRGGWVVGHFQAPGKPDHEPTELVGDLGSGSFAPAGITMAFGMNRHGWVAGFDAGPQRTQIPAIAGDGKKLVLPIPSGAKPADEVSAASISDDGRTVGGTIMSGDQHTPVVWTCHP